MNTGKSVAKCDTNSEALTVLGLIVDNGSYGDISVLKQVSMISKGSRSMIRASAAYAKHRAEYVFYLSYVRGRISLNKKMTKDELADILINTCADTGYFIPCDALMGDVQGIFHDFNFDTSIQHVAKHRIKDPVAFDLQIENIFDYFGYN